MGWFHSLPIRRKLSWTILIICGLVLIMAATAIALYEVFDFRRALARDSTVLADVVATNVSGTLAFDDEVAARYALAALRSDQHVIAAALYKTSGTRFADYVRREATHSFPPTAGASRAEFADGGLIIVRPVSHIGKNLGAIYLKVDLGGITDRLVLFSVIVLVILGVSVIVAAILTSWLQRPITEPIIQLTETARSISERKDFSVRAATQAGGEIGTLTAAFNEMLNAIEKRRSELLAVNEQLRGEVVERQLAEGRVTAQAARLTQLNLITRGIAERQDVESIFQAVTVSLEDQLPAEFACVCMYETDRAVLRVASIGARGAGFARALQMEPDAAIPIDANGLARCMRGDLVYEPDTELVPMPFPRRLADAGLRAMVLAPLLVESRVFGVLIAARRVRDSFTSGECEFLKQLTEHVALGTHQAQLYEALQRAYDDLRQTQQAVMQQERLRALGQMASGIAHDINNAISPVSLYIESLLEKEPNLSTQARERLTIVQRAVEDVAHTVSRMREFYRQRPADLLMVRVALNRIVDQVVDLTKARWHDMPQQRGAVIELQRDYMPTLPVIKGIESELREALTNLIFNAVDAMNRGGVLTLRTFVAEYPRAGTPTETEPRVVLEVVDTGSGMSEETLRRCVEPFFTTKGDRGTGLGLAMVYGVVQRHGAEIEFDSIPGRGTNVRLIFAVAPGRETLTHIQPRIPTQKLKLLVIDDDPLLIKSIQDILESDGHSVTAAGGGQLGINTFVDAVGTKGAFNAVITDLGMPYVDGRRVAAAVKAASPTTPVFLLTGWGNRLIAEGDVPPEVDRILSKPPKLRDLRDALSTVLPVSQIS